MGGVKRLLRIRNAHHGNGHSVKVSVNRFDDLVVFSVPHGLRKNAVNALLEAGCTIAEVSAITGQTHQVVEHYAAQVNRRKLGKSAIVKFERARDKSA